MSGVFDVGTSGVAVTAQQDLLEINAASTKPIVWLGFTLSQTTEVGDAQEEELLIQLKSGQTTSGSGGSSPTPVNTDPASGAAASFTAEANNTTKASAGTIVVHGTWAWNVRTQLEVVFTPEQQKIMAASRRSTLELGSTPADSITMNVNASIQEIG